MIDQALSWQQMIDQTVTWKDLDAIARKHNPRVHIMPDTMQIRAEKALAAEVERVLRTKNVPISIDSRGKDQLRAMTKVRQDRRTQLVDRIAEYICTKDRANVVTVAELAALFGRTDSTISVYCNELADDLRIQRSVDSAHAQRLLLWGKHD